MSKNTDQNTSIAIDMKTAKSLQNAYDRQIKANNLLVLLEDYYVGKIDITPREFFNRARVIAGIELHD